MPKDRIEVPSMKNRLQRRRRRGTGPSGKFSHAALSNGPVQPLEIIDEAFAGFTRVDAGMSQVDRPCQAAEFGADTPQVKRSVCVDVERLVAPEIIARLSAQLTALDKQHEQLSRLLQTIEGLPA